MSHESSPVYAPGPVHSNPEGDFLSHARSAQNGRQFDTPPPGGRRPTDEELAAEFQAMRELAAQRAAEEIARRRAEAARISEPFEPHLPSVAQKIEPPCPPPPAAAPFPQVVLPDRDEIRQRRRRGRPAIVDEEARDQIVTLLGAGVSLRQTAGILGFARNTIAAAMERDEEFAEEVHQARQRAQVSPLNCILREASTNWRAATWLLSYLERQQERERSRREQVLEKADELIQRDVAQDLRTQARDERLADAAADEEEQAESLRRPRRK